MLCFIDADWPLVDGSFTTRGVAAVVPRKLFSTLSRTDHSRGAFTDLHRTLASALPSA